MRLGGPDGEPNRQNTLNIVARRISRSRRRAAIIATPFLVVGSLAGCSGAIGTGGSNPIESAAAYFKALCAGGDKAPIDIYISNLNSMSMASANAFVFNNGAECSTKGITVGITDDSRDAVPTGTIVGGHRVVNVGPLHPDQIQPSSNTQDD